MLKPSPPAPDSRLPTPDSRLPTPDSRLPSTKVNHPIKNCDLWALYLNLSR
ncbi:hypothetical protein [Moorena sp. SIO3B2]|uniref:Uncharacterized protein n=1 Tax=Moorena producens (strain JHB) TaxID=1454205 RepID=A0A9Q9SUZ7_MOOP1|nr:hypothetical protein [Moorena sp. SIO3B2]NEP30215.1 hypothetical protein [Moorena sp. SIO3B2]WAN70154.1 hypothetical protein BJP36_39570 [Moorena producens JHB]